MICTVEKNRLARIRRILFTARKALSLSCYTQRSARPARTESGSAASRAHCGYDGVAPPTSSTWKSMRSPNQQYNGTDRANNGTDRANKTCWKRTRPHPIISARLCSNISKNPPVIPCSTSRISLYLRPCTLHRARRMYIPLHFERCTLQRACRMVRGMLHRWDPTRCQASGQTTLVGCV